MQDVLVVPQRVVPRIGDLDATEVSDLFLSVQRISKVIERAYSADGFNIAIQVCHIIVLRDESS